MLECVLSMFDLFSMLILPCYNMISSWFRSLMHDLHSCLVMPLYALTCLGSVPPFLACFKLAFVKLVCLFCHDLALSIVALVNLIMHYIAPLYLACWP